MDDETRDDIIEDTDADTRDDAESTDDARDDIVEDTDADTRDVMNMLDEIVRRIDALADLVARAQVPNGSVVQVPDGFVSIDDLDLD